MGSISSSCFVSSLLLVSYKRTLFSLHATKTLILSPLKPPEFPSFRRTIITFQKIPTGISPPLSASSLPSSSVELQPIKELPPELQEIVNLFRSVQEPKAKYEQLLFYGKNLKPLDAQFKTRENKVQGCVSQVWVRAFFDEERNVVFEADSDSVLTKGLAALLVQGLSGRPVPEILRVTPDFAVLLGFQQSLTPSRNNGFLNMLKLMQKKALQLAVEAEENKGFTHEADNDTTSVSDSGSGSRADENDALGRDMLQNSENESNSGALGSRGMRNGYLIMRKGILQLAVEAEENKGSTHEADNDKTSVPGSGSGSRADENDALGRDMLQNSENESNSGALGSRGMRNGFLIMRKGILQLAVEAEENKGSTHEADNDKTSVPDSGSGSRADENDALGRDMLQNSENESSSGALGSRGMRNGFLIMRKGILQLAVEAEENKGSTHEADNDTTSVSDSGSGSRASGNEDSGRDMLQNSENESNSGALGSRGMRIREKLERELNPVELEVEDVSYQHAGHAGVRGGNGDGEMHFNLRIVSDNFQGKSLVKRRRLIYDMLQDELQSGLQALSIVAKTPSED
ncbi:PREDICTED: sufE-like protein 1, chloroplastic/mitochondrial [Tarenaya hassleriana]|uniref:sufE-like protein 1, chloroplastic/mitochondrial n=1 Tax=Tarenaya hassleriana TaxID=28532 RepID=UPI00053C1736|nr:PREDICTED: sufE-like protein 1, chloroplastic/mitochondrial [Tarenaya hassleriana]